MNWAERFYAVFGREEGQVLWWQMSLRAAVVFLFGLVLVRLFGRRAFGKYTALDIVLAMIIGSNLSRTLTGNAPFFATMVATTVIVALYWIFDHAAARLPVFSRMLKGDPVWLMRNGVLDRETMKRSGVTQGDIEEAARRSGLGGIAGLREAVFERNGEISTIHR